MLSADTFHRLFDVVREANDDEQVRVVIVTAKGKDSLGRRGPELGAGFQSGRLGEDDA